MSMRLHIWVSGSDTWWHDCIGAFESVMMSETETNAKLKTLAANLQGEQLPKKWIEMADLLVMSSSQGLIRQGLWTRHAEHVVALANSAYEKSSGQGAESIRALLTSIESLSQVVAPSLQQKLRIVVGDAAKHVADLERNNKRDALLKEVQEFRADSDEKKVAKLANMLSNISIDTVVPLAIAEPFLQQVHVSMKLAR